MSNRRRKKRKKNVVLGGFLLTALAVLVVLSLALTGGLRIGYMDRTVYFGRESTVKEGFEVPPRSLIAGVPGKVRREVTDEEFEMIRRSAQGYVDKVRLYLEERDG